MKTSTLILGLATVLIAAGCTELKSGFTVDHNQKIARAEGSVSDPFRQALANGYKVLGDEEYAEKDMSSADLFYRKSAIAASGTNVAPEDPNDWSSLRASDRNDVAAMRSSLITWIAATKQLNPQAAAAQQLKYECWIEELSEQAYDEAAACKPSIGPIAQAAPVPMAAIPPCQQNPNGTDQNGKLCQEGVVYFGFDRYDLLNYGKSDITKQTASQQASALDLIMRQIVASKAARIDVYGRADSSGPDNYNYGLSDCRARSVVDALKARGLPASVEVRVIPLGETSLIAPTADNVRDNTNRVVMVAYQTNRNAPLAISPMSAPRVDAFGCGTSRHPYPMRVQKASATR
jgi:outer membrane protein OmpA-like peptidoglycan-associated protein